MGYRGNTLFLIAHECKAEYDFLAGMSELLLDDSPDWAAVTGPLDERFNLRVYLLTMRSGGLCHMLCDSAGMVPLSCIGVDGRRDQEASRLRSGRVYRELCSLLRCFSWEPNV